MKRLAIIIGVVTSSVIGLIVIFGIAVVLFRVSALPILLLTGFFYGWMLFTYLHYRHGRQSEFLLLLSTAVESNAPLVPALEGYLRDRPRGAAREFWVGLLLFFVLPGYYWFWHRRHSYDSKVARVARFLEIGCLLSLALRLVPGVASRETQLAVAVGESTGQLARCLRASSPARVSTVWLEVLPRFLYPMILLVFVTFITGFWTVFLLPKMQRIFFDFKTPLPQITVQVGDLGQSLMGEGAYVGLFVLAGLVVLIALLYNPSPLWYVPGIGRVYRMSVRSQVLRMLAVLLDAGKPAPEALVILADSGAFSAGARRRLRAASKAVGQGQPLTESLRKAGLLQPTMVPLARSAERVNNLPRVLNQLGENPINRLVRTVRRLSLLAFPASVIGVGALVGFIVLGMYFPLIKLLSRLTE